MTEPIATHGSTARGYKVMLLSHLFLFLTNRKADKPKDSEAMSTGMKTEGNTTTTAENIDPELLSTLNVRISEGKVELSESRVKAGHL
ncbi:hypothetical protein C7271_14645 [filamentous cyanobacterium CCP5]|nr:hypothetical protein C7271_14645 [filamentous cyanobacterium CCP5]